MPVFWNLWLHICFVPQAFFETLHRPYRDPPTKVNIPTLLCSFAITFWTHAACPRVCFGLTFANGSFTTCRRALRKSNIIALKTLCVQRLVHFLIICTILHRLSKQKCINAFAFQNPTVFWPPCCSLGWPAGVLCYFQRLTFWSAWPLQAFQRFTTFAQKVGRHNRLLKYLEMNSNSVQVATTCLPWICWVRHWIWSFRSAGAILVTGLKEFMRPTKTHTQHHSTSFLWELITESCSCALFLCIEYS